CPTRWMAMVRTLLNEVLRVVHKGTRPNAPNSTGPVPATSSRPVRTAWSALRQPSSSQLVHVPGVVFLPSPASPQVLAQDADALRIIRRPRTGACYPLVLPASQGAPGDAKVPHFASSTVDPDLALFVSLGPHRYDLPRILDAARLLRRTAVVA